jgi:DNA-binding response OmpR family regulator
MAPGEALCEASPGPRSQVGGEWEGTTSQLWPSTLRVAAVDRDRAFLRALSAQSLRLGWTLVALADPPTAEVLLARRMHAVIVDIVVLGPRWEHWLARHPVRVPQLGVLVCTGPSSVEQRIRGLNLGADDWVTKPCAVEELVARAHAVVRARRLSVERGAARRLRSGELEIRPEVFDAFVDGRPAGLTRGEFGVLMCLAREEGRVLGRERIYQDVWGYARAKDERALDTAIRKIRSKLVRISPDCSYIQTHRGIGYRFAVARVCRSLA